jgi:hypothetical protein
MRVAGVSVLALMMFAMPAAWSAPTCQDRSGMTTRCGTEGAMPVGWTAPEADRHLPEGNPRDIWEAAAGILLLFALIALLPEFDGWGTVGEAERKGPVDPFE